MAIKTLKQGTDHLYPNTVSDAVYHDGKTLNTILGYTDISSIGDGTITGAIDSINDDISTLKTNFQLGCSKIAGAITAQGVNTASDASIDTIIANARQIVGPSTDTTINGQTSTTDLNLQTIYAGNSSVDATTLSSILGISVTGTSKVYITI